jgi:methionyl-tRNA formyltransferase
MQRRLLFMGSKKSGLAALSRLLEQLPVGSISTILCPDDRLDARSEYNRFCEVASRYKLPIHLVATSQETIAHIERYAPSTVIVHGWYRMIPVQHFPDIDFLGFHYSPLPRYRGNAPLVWQIINGETQLGVSFFTLTASMDEGDLVDQAFFELKSAEDISVAIQKANELMLEMINAFAHRWISGNIVKRPQSYVTPTYCGLRTPEDGHIDWRLDATSVNNFIRAQAPPYPGAFSQMSDGCIVHFWGSEIEPRNFFGVPGAVVDVLPDSIVVACGTGALRIRAVQAEVSGSAVIDPAVRSLKVRFK